MQSRTLSLLSMQGKVKDLSSMSSEFCAELEKYHFGKNDGTGIEKVQIS
jgi:hypothetical protein